VTSETWLKALTITNFCFVAVGEIIKVIIYAFGGQDDWDDDRVLCFQTTSEIQILGDGVTSAPIVMAPTETASGHVVSSFAMLAFAWIGWSHNLKHH
jgi:hypothetical protein